MRDHRQDLLDLYEIFFAGKELELREVDAAVVEKATELRAAIGLKTPDAIHAATAMLAGAAAFWTTDTSLAKSPGMTVVVFPAV